MPNDRNIIIPEELKDAPEEIKGYYKEWVKLEWEQDEHPLRYFDAPDKYGDSVKFDCKAPPVANIKKAKRLGAYTKEVEKEFRKRNEEMKKLRMQRSHMAARYNGWLNRNNKGKNVLDFRKGDILQAFGEYKRIDEVRQLIKDWGFNIDTNRLTEFYHENIDEIQDRRVRFQAQENDYYLATGTGRVESLSWLFDQMRKLFEDTKNVRYGSEMRAIIEQVRKEIKGDEIRLTVDGKIDVTATIQANRTIQELNQRMPINLFIVSLVAAKKGVEPSSIMGQLGNSFYAHYNGFSELSADEEEMKLPSHFINNYDWQEIENIHKDKEDRATNKLLERKMRQFFKDNDIVYNGNVNESVRMLEAKLRGEAVPEVVDVQPLEVEVIEKKEEISDKRKLLQQLLDEKKKKLE